MKTKYIRNMKEQYLKRIDEWQQVYTVHLAKAMEQYPDEYMPRLSAEEIAAKARHTILDRGLGAISIVRSHGWQRSAKQFGIKNTYKEWEAWFLS